MKYPEEEKYYILKYTRKNDSNKGRRIAKVCVVRPRIDQIVMQGGVRIKERGVCFVDMWPMSSEEFWRNYRAKPFN